MVFLPVNNIRFNLKHIMRRLFILQTVSQHIPIESRRLPIAKDIASFKLFYGAMLNLEMREMDSSIRKPFSSASKLID